MKPIHAHLNVVLLIVLSFFYFSCGQEDDIESIFFDKIWYISSLTINGVPIKGDEIKELYLNKESYYIFFYSNYSFSGVLSKNTAISGTCQINGKKHIIHIMFDDNLIASTTFNNSIYNILKNSSYYSGDTNNITIYQNKSNFINFTNKK